MTQTTTKSVIVFPGNLVVGAGQAAGSEKTNTITMCAYIAGPQA